jgi:hypothetical protein
MSPFSELNGGGGSGKKTRISISRIRCISEFVRIFGSLREAYASLAFPLALKSCRVEMKRCEQMNLLGRFLPTRHEPKINVVDALQYDNHLQGSLYFFPLLKCC